MTYNQLAALLDTTRIDAKERCLKLAEELYQNSMQSGERERLDLPVGEDFWIEKAKKSLARNASRR